MPALRRPGAGWVADQQPVHPGSLGAGGGIGQPEAVDAAALPCRLQHIEHRNVRREFDAHLILRGFTGNSGQPSRH